MNGPDAIFKLRKWVDIMTIIITEKAVKKVLKDLSIGLIKGNDLKRHTSINHKFCVYHETEKCSIISTQWQTEIIWIYMHNVTLTYWYWL